MKPHSRAIVAVLVPYDKLVIFTLQFDISLKLTFCPFDSFDFDPSPSSSLSETSTSRDFLSISTTRPASSSYSFSRFPNADKNSSFSGITLGGSTSPLGRLGSNRRAAHFESLFLAKSNCSCCFSVSSIRLSSPFAAFPLSELVLFAFFSSPPITSPPCSLFCRLRGLAPSELSPPPSLLSTLSSSLSPLSELFPPNMST
mmetsp:Transcript_26001/g.54771  ORF Transcript_26001/g.54771 Transcript_26001/m.54771 type:complete len:200 (+) Transcript_26001:1161-1760(+)